MSLVVKMKTPWRVTTRFGRKALTYLPELNFITLHYLYFIFTSLIAALILWGSATPERSLHFTDALFLAVSAMTEAGLNTVNLSTLNTFQQFVLFVLIMMGSAIFVSAFVVHVRQRAFDRSLHSRYETGRNQSRDEGQMSNDLQLEREQTTAVTTELHDLRQRRSYPNVGTTSQHDHITSNSAGFPLSSTVSAPALNHQGLLETPSIDPAAKDDDAITIRSPLSSNMISETQLPDHITFGPETRFRPTARSTESPLRRVISFSGVGARPSSRSRMPLTMHSGLSQNTVQSLHAAEKPNLGTAATISRNSNFHHLTEAERTRLGGKEYRAVKFLGIVVPLYFVLWQLLGCLSLAAYTAHYYASTTRTNGLDPWWVGAFNAVSAFNNSGMSLLDANMTVFNKSVYMLITMGLLILAGNTCFPIFLRLIVWSIYKLLPSSEKFAEFRQTLKFLLDHPRRCYTNLFPSPHTWWLLLSVILLNGIDCAAFAILNIGNDAITHFAPGIEFIDGLFQALAVRSGGFYVVPISSVRISLQVLYVVMMYISAFPVAITIRNSNVYEERSLGIYSDDPGYDFLEAEMGTAKSWVKKRFGWNRPEEKSHFLQQQLRAQLAHDLWWLALAVFLIMIIEGPQFQQDPATFSVFNTLFEIVSAYGTVGISVGLPNEAYSFSGAWHTLSKLILCAVMLRGRHRGLPVAIDKAVLLPNERLHQLEEEDAHIRLERRSMHDDRTAC